MSVKRIPDGYHSVTPYLIVRGAAAAIDYYTRAFDAKEKNRMADPSGKVGHAELQIGDSTVMLADEFPDLGLTGPLSLGGTSVLMLIYVEDVDAQFEKAVAAGGTVTRPLADQFYGDRSGTLKDPFGHCWTLASHVEDVPVDEMKRRMEAAIKG